MQRAMPVSFDLVAVLVFALVGRLSHGLDAVGVLSTAWPFLVACLAAWGVLVALGDPGTGARGAIVVWALTLTGGMGLRVVSGEGTAVAFVIVAAIFLAVVFGGWRLGSAWLTRGGAVAR